MSLGINIEHLVAHTHIQNVLAKSFYQTSPINSSTLLMKTKLPISTWEHAIMHVVALIRI